MQSTSFKHPNLHAIALSFAVVLTSWSQANAQHRETPASCAIHFQARADWMRGLEGQAETIGLMETYAGIMEHHARELWLSTPRDWRMQTGPFPTSNPLQFRKRFYQDAVLDQLTNWAVSDQNSTARPLCMQDATCIECTELLGKVVQ